MVRTNVSSCEKVELASIGFNVLMGILYEEAEQFLEERDKLRHSVAIQKSEEDDDYFYILLDSEVYCT